jgi:hypothetical protein
MTVQFGKGDGPAEIPFTFAVDETGRAISE